MRIAVCSLSRYTHVCEFLDTTAALSNTHELCYYLGHRSSAAESLLAQHGIDHTCTFEHGCDGGGLTAPAEAKTTEQLFLDYFFRHAQLALPGLIARLRVQRPHLICSHLRDYAGPAAAELLDIPLVTFGSHQSPWRDERVDPPFGAGLGRTTSGRRLELAWKFHRRFNQRVDESFNSRIRRPLGLADVGAACTSHSPLLTLLCLPHFMSNKNSPEPSHVRFVGPQYTRRTCAPDQREQRLVAQIAGTPTPRVLLALGTTYDRTLVPELLAALADFPGTVVVAGKIESAAGVFSGFFRDVGPVHRLCDAVISTGAGKSVTDALAHGRAMLCVPCQGEQKENALALQDLGAALVADRQDINHDAITSRLQELLDNPSYRVSAERLGSRMKEDTGDCSDLIEELFSTLSRRSAR